MRTAGILFPVSSLPGNGGIGTLGHAARHFVDFLARAGQAFWQVLPIGPTSFGNSPYQSFSAFAGNPYFIDLELLCEVGLLQPHEMAVDFGNNPTRVDYGALYHRRFGVLEQAVQRQNKDAPEYRAFCGENAWWLDDYALYMALKEAHNNAGFASWPEALRRHRPEALHVAGAQYGPRADFWRCLQYFFHSQWAALKRYANDAGVGIIGDIPIYVSDDSSDLWANPGLFCLDEDERPALVAGVPPDAFSADGQLWGNPLYNWPQHQRSGYEWWIRRLRQAGQLFDVTRIDHFRGFCDYYTIPAGNQTARGGAWEKGPGLSFIGAVHGALPYLKVIAEDLGFLTPEVHELLKASGYPGMKVLQFAFDSREESDYLPHNYSPHCIVYTGTHDNTTSRAWGEEAAPQDAAFAREYLGLAGEDSFAPAFVRAALASVGSTAVVPLWDWLDYGAEARFNTPSTLSDDNWSWRLLPGVLTGELAAHIRRQTQIYGRVRRFEEFEG